MSQLTDQEEADLCPTRAAHLRDVAARMKATVNRQALLEAATFWDFLAELAMKRASTAR